MSEYPATLADLAEVEQRLDARLSTVERRVRIDPEVTDEKIVSLRSTLTGTREELQEVRGVLIALSSRVNELERLWVVAQANPELIRELAVEALKGRTG